MHCVRCVRHRQVVGTVGVSLERTTGEVAESAGAGMRSGDRYALVTGMGVRAAQRRLGVATQLMAACDDVARGWLANEPGRVAAPLLVLFVSKPNTGALQ